MQINYPKVNKAKQIIGNKYLNTRERNKNEKLNVP